MLSPNLGDASTVCLNIANTVPKQSFLKMGRAGVSGYTVYGIDQRHGKALQVILPACTALIRRLEVFRGARQISDAVFARSVTNEPIWNIRGPTHASQ